MAKNKKVSTPTILEQIFGCMSLEDQKLFRIFSELQAVTAAVYGDLSEEGKKSAMDIMDLAKKMQDKEIIKKEMEEKK